VNSGQSSLTAVNSEQPRGFFHRRLVQPVAAMLRMGSSPERLAWSIAAGAAIGINPLLGSTTALCIAVALVFRLNIVASQLGNHLVYPLELALLIPFLKAGSLLFRAAPVPIAPQAILKAARSHPIALVEQLWLWEWHALVVWAAVASILLPVIALTLTPLLRRLMIRLNSLDRPVCG
jgi:uncharacterized protein (DUF2062 family)